MEQLIQISEEIKSLWQDTAIGFMSAKVRVKDTPGNLQYKLQKEVEQVRQELSLEDISSLPQIYTGRKAYRSFGKAPTRYRLSSEALFRRILKGQGMYFVNNIVNINNLLSIQSRLPICAFDGNNIQAPATFRLGRKNEEYYGIGRGKLNIENLPVFSDVHGAFGSPTSDSERVKITTETRLLYMSIVSFQGTTALHLQLDKLKTYLQTYAEARDIEQQIIH